MLAWIVSLGSWNWFILAALLFLVEVLAPGMFMMWLGLSAILVGIMSLVAGIVIPPIVMGILALAAGILILIGR